MVTQGSICSSQMDLSRGFHTSLPSKLDGANKSLNLANGVIEIDGALALEDFNNSKTDENGQVMRSGVGRGSRDKMFSLSQRLLSALINEGPEDDRLMASEEALLDQNSNPSLPPRSHMELDFDRRDPEGESDCDNVKSELDPWRSGKREALISEGCPLINGHPARLWGDDEGGRLYFLELFGIVLFPAHTYGTDTLWIFCRFNLKLNGNFVPLSKGSNAFNYKGIKSAILLNFILDHPY